MVAAPERYRGTRLAGIGLFCVTPNFFKLDVLENMPRCVRPGVQQGWIRLSIEGP
jgi:hypothetical protein